jgi:hypothetical protein
VLTLRRGTFGKWRRGWQQRLISAEKLDRAVGHEARKLLGGIWRVWREVGVVCHPIDDVI